MIRLLHIPTGTILYNIPSYLHFKGMIRMTCEDQIKNDTFWGIVEVIISELDAHKMLDDPCGMFSSMDSALTYFNTYYCLEEFEVLDG